MTRPRRIATTIAAVLVQLVVLSSRPALAQETPTHDDAYSEDASTVSPARILLPAVAGSAAGMFVGFLAGADTGFGNDDSGYGGGFLFGTIGSVVGSTLGAHLGSRGEVHPSVALATSTVGILAGVAGAVLGGMAADDAGVFIGYSFGQGAFVALFSALVTNTTR